MSVETNAVATLPVDLLCVVCVWLYVRVRVWSDVVCVGMTVCAVLVSQGLFLLLLTLGGAICDVVEAGSDPRQMQQRPRRLLHLLVVTLRGLLYGCRPPFLQWQRVANAPHSVFGPGQTATRQSSKPCPRTTSLFTQGLLGNVGSGGSGDMRIKWDLPGLRFDVGLDFHCDDIVVIQWRGRIGVLRGAQPAGGFGGAISVVLLEVLSAG